jgi:predicted short-subunit dehydrogenase-like oxidoreductase (DUF2520 family)
MYNLKTMSGRFIFIGAGNLATRLSVEFKRIGYEIVQIFSRTETSAKALAEKLGAGFTTDPHKIMTGSGIIYFVVLKDSAVHNILPHVAFENNLLVHCSGSLSLAELEKYSENTGVFYPLQTFSKTRNVDFEEVPVFIESKNRFNEKMLFEIAGRITKKVMNLDSHKRLNLHIAAVFACNFVNHFYTIAGQLLKSENIPFEVLHPIIAETAAKVHIMDPEEAQTGPAVRFDKNIISAHLENLADYPEIRNLYKRMSVSINNHYKLR